MTDLAPSVTVLVPTYQRPDHLRRCLAALERQTRPPEQLIVVRRSDDRAAAKVIVEFGNGRRAGARPIDAVLVDEPGVIHAISHGLAVASSDVVALTDDDAEPRADWLECLLRQYADDRVAAVGGLDVQPAARRTSGQSKVGVIEPWGRVRGAHELGGPPTRDVDHLRGVNMSARREWWRIDRQLRGNGAQHGFELDTCLAARRAGRRVIYEPGAVVDHARAPRPDHERRDDPEFGERMDRTHNEMYLMLKWLPLPRALAAFAYGLLVGNRHSPGPALVVERLARGEPPREVASHAVAGWAGRIAALLTLIRSAADPKWRRERLRPAQDGEAR